MRILLAFVCLIGMANNASAQQSEPPEPLPSVELSPELDRVLRDYERHWEARNARALAALFTPDGFVLRSGHPPIRGREAIEEAYRNAGGPLHLRALAFAQSDSIAYIIGGYRPTTDRPDAGKFVLTLRRSPDGRWHIASDMDNRNGRP